MKNKLFIIVVLVCCVFCGKSVYARDAKTTILPTDTTVAGARNCLVGLQGSYAGDVKEAVKRINEIRLEACVNGYPDPRDSKRKLTKSDYVAIKWSSDYEYIARIRASEAAVLTEHARPNGKSYGDVTSPNGIECYAEVLAWQSWEGTIVDAIDNWYGEKSTWVSQGNGVTGHYTQMIDPDVRYAGVATFNSNTGSWLSSSAGKFGTGKDGMSQTEGAAISNCIQTIEVPSDNLGTAYLYKEEMNTTKDIYKIKDTVTFDLARDLKLKGDTSTVFELGNITWTTSDASVAKVDNYGKVTIIGYGKVVICATSDTGVSATKTINVKSNVKKSSISKIIAGKKSLILSWKKVAGNGYEIQYSTDKKFSKNVKIKKIKNSKTIKVTLKKLKKQKKYYVRIRTIKKINGKEYYSNWSSKKSKKTK